MDIYQGRNVTVEKATLLHSGNPEVDIAIDKLAFSALQETMKSFCAPELEPVNEGRKRKILQRGTRSGALFNVDSAINAFKEDAESVLMEAEDKLSKLLDKEVKATEKQRRLQELARNKQIKKI